MSVFGETLTAWERPRSSGMREVHKRFMGFNPLTLSQDFVARHERTAVRTLAGLVEQNENAAEMLEDMSAEDLSAEWKRIQAVSCGIVLSQEEIHAWQRRVWLAQVHGDRELQC